MIYVNLVLHNNKTGNNGGEGFVNQDIDVDPTIFLYQDVLLANID